MVNIYVVYQHIGYKKHPSQKNKLIIDENVSDIVRTIFDMYVIGHGSKEIVKYLNINNYLSPLGYRKTHIIKDKNKTNYNWNEVTVCNMLKNEVYIGNTVQNKRTVISYKVKRLKNVEAEDQIRVNNTHETIIDKNTFETVQCILEKRGANSKLKHEYLLRGVIYCYHCKRKLQIVIKKRGSLNSYITCSNYKQRGCYPLNINYEKFEKSIIDIIKQMCNLYINKDFLYEIYKKSENKTLLSKDYNKKKEKIDKDIFEINNNIDKMYIDKLKNIIAEEDYIRISSKLRYERENLIKQKERILEIQENLNINSNIKGRKEFDELVKEFLKFDNIDKISLYQLVNKIEIDKNKKIYIYFNFSNPNIKRE